MEAVAYFIIALALIAAGCVATVLSVYVIPSWLRVRGQAHGRLTGLSVALHERVGGPKRMVGGPGQAVGAPAPSTVLA